MPRTVPKAKATKFATGAAPGLRAVRARSSSPWVDQRPACATVAELIRATGWQAHSARGAVLRRKYGKPITIATNRADADVFQLGA